MTDFQWKHEVKPDGTVTIEITRDGVQEFVHACKPGWTPYTFVRNNDELAHTPTWESYKTALENVFREPEQNMGYCRALHDRAVAAIKFCEHLSTETLEELTNNRVGAATLVQWIRRCNTFNYIDTCDGEIFDEYEVCIECDHRVDQTELHAEDCLLKKTLDIIAKAEKP